ncbi:MAG: hypothetical protein M4579_004302 [Chaenotheca gracillima]|nr:MAG: hypothetical protein M4579_004302 [Chaenotheca gracillima]
MSTFGRLLSICLVLAVGTLTSPISLNIVDKPPIDPCAGVKNKITGYKLNAGIPEDYWGPWVSASGVSCAASSVTCSVGQDYSVTKSISYSAGVNAGLTLGEIFSLGVNSDVSYTTGESKGTTAGEICPPSYECGLSYTIKYSHWAGEAILYTSSSCPQAPTPFDFTTTEKSNAGVDSGTDLSIRFSACITPTSRNQTVLNNLGPCPEG